MSFFMDRCACGNAKDAERTLCIVCMVRLLKGMSPKVETTAETTAKAAEAEAKKGGRS